MDILVDAYQEQFWVATLENGVLQGIEVDPSMEQVRWGAIYWAKVARIDKARDAAFVNLDGDNIGILYNADIRMKQKDGSLLSGGEKAIGQYLEPGMMVAVQTQDAFLADPEIGEHFAKAEGKSPKVTMDIALHGRHVIYAPFEQENRISKRIHDKDMRKAMSDMLGSLKDMKGCILRASAANTQTDMLVREARIHAAAWEQIESFLEGDQPQLIMDGPDAVQRSLSDNASKVIDHIYVTTLDHFHHIEEWCDVYAPDLVPRIKPVELEDGAQELSLFDHHDILPKIEGLLRPYAILNGGGNILVQPTAALTAIDVNSGSDDRSHASINHDAAQEIARHMRLRNMGGIVMIDFLRSKSKKEKDALLKAFGQFCQDDPCTVQIHGFTKLGLVELTRQRRTPALLERLREMIE